MTVGRQQLDRNETAGSMALRWDDRLSRGQFDSLAEQFKRGHISGEDLWWLLGFGGVDEQRTHQSRKASRRQESLALPSTGLKTSTPKAPTRWTGKYLVRNDKPAGAAHFWNGKDTLCRLYSTGGIRRRKAYGVFDTALDRRICPMCAERG